MNQFFHILNQVLPILILLLLGFVLRRKKVFEPGTVAEFKKLVVNVALPALLFVSFMEIELKVDYLPVILVIFSLCMALYFFGKLLGGVGFSDHENFPFLMTGFEYGMLGVSIFGSVYGMDKIGYIAVVDLGHEAFIWFFFIPLLIMRRDGKTRPSEIVSSIVRSPVIIGLVGGIVCNLLGLPQGLRAGRSPAAS